MITISLFAFLIIFIQLLKQNSIYITNIIPNITILVIISIVVSFYPVIFFLFKRGVFGQHTIEINQNNLQETNDLKVTTYQWENIQSVFQCKRFITIVPTKRATSVFFIPKKSFVNEEACNLFFSVALNYYSKAIINKKAAK